MKRRSPTDNPPMGTFEMKSALSPTEGRLFNALIEAVGNELYVFPKMSLHEIIHNTHEDDFERISSKSIDFMIYRKEIFEPKCAIELDDKSHENKTTLEHDRVKDYYLNTAGIPVIRLPVYKKFLPKKLRDIIINASPIKSMAYPINPVTVEVETVTIPPADG